MREVIVPAPAVKVAVAYLAAADWPWPVEVRGRRPNPTRGVGRLVTVRRTGGVRPSLVTDGAFLSFECFADAPDEAETLTNHAYALMLAMAGQAPLGVRCNYVETLAGPSERFDAAGDIDRFAFSVVAHLRATPV